MATRKPLVVVSGRKRELPAGDMVARGDVDLGATLSAIADGTFVFGDRNHLDNPNFDLWERGTSFSGIAAAGYVADRWTLTGSTYTGRVCTRQAFSAAEATAYNARYFLRLDASAQSSFDNRVYQFIEGVALAGKTIVISVLAKAGVAGQTLSLVMRTYADLTNYNNVSTAAQTLNTTWTRHTFTFTAAALPNVTVTDMARSMLLMQFSNTANVFDLAQCDLKIGTEYTPFVPRPLSIEKLRCWRYYWRHTPAYPNAFGSTSSASATTHYLQLPFPVPMRVPPTALEQAGVASYYSIYTTALHVCSAVPTFANASRDSAFVTLTTTTGTAGHAGFARAESGTAFLAFSAEF